MENKILDLFLFNYKLKFNEIEKLLSIRSNKLAYYLKKFVQKKILDKDREYYLLSETSEYLIPYLSKKKSILPVILIHMGNKNKTFLYKREKRPYKNLLSLPGGRPLVGEKIPDATKRIMKEKFNTSVNFRKINSICLEHVKKEGKIIHSFLLIFVSAQAKDKVCLTELRKNRKKIIKSDYNLITNHLNSATRLPVMNSKL